MSKSFALAAAEATGIEDALPFEMEGDDTQLYAYRPTEGQIALLLGATAGGARPEQMAGAFMELFWSLMEEETARVLRARLADRTDRFGLTDLMNIVEWLVEEASGFPTQQPPASTRSRATSGQRSTATARQRASTRSSSPRVASAT
jgi:hypothetical protein